MSDAKNVIRQELIDSGQAVPYSEPASEVISRSADKCVCALMDQWYLNYGEQTWKEQSLEILKDMDTYGPETRNQFE
ncbi:MAG: hypothetical protein IBJ00_06340, partial [Alphaproteobacteria bacterium]|nr:hypothetical protein [Alphaproteobacteria bacterium]